MIDTIPQDSLPGHFLHVTLRENLASIQEHGLLLSKSNNPTDRRIWLITQDHLQWAINHVMAREGGGAYYYVLVVQLERAPWKMFNFYSKATLHYTTWDIPPDHILGVIELGCYVVESCAYNHHTRELERIGGYWYQEAAA